MLPLADIFARIPPDSEAIVHDDARWTFRDLDRRSAALAAWLQRCGVAPGTLVAFALPNGPEFLALTFGIYRAGATPAPLSPKLSASETEEIRELTQPAAFVTASDLAAANIHQEAAPAAAPLALSWKACTSGGSTGRLKVIVDARPGGFAKGTDFIAIPENSRVLVPGPLYHNASFSAAVFALWRGNTVVTMPRFDASATLCLASRERIAWAMAVPTMLHRIMALSETERAVHDLSQWRTVVHTAAPMPAWLKRAWIDWRGPDHIWEVYGATEGLARCWIGGREWLEHPGSVGRPIGGARLKIVSPDGSACPPGLPGEVFMMPPGGPGSTYRYIGAQRRADAEGWESVGDVGWLDEDGYLYLADRKDDLIISGGINIWPAEVEAALLRNPAIRSCAVYGRPDLELGAAVHAVIESDFVFDAAQLSAFLSDHLVPAKHPRSLELTDRPVRDDSGKVRKPRLVSLEKS